MEGQSYFRRKDSQKEHLTLRQVQSKLLKSANTEQELAGYCTWQSHRPVEAGCCQQREGEHLNIGENQLTEGENE